MSIVLTGSTSGSVTIQEPAVAGTTTYTLTDKSGTIAPIVHGTAVTASGTAVDFTGIPSWVKKITVLVSGISFSGTSIPRVQLGTSSGFVTSGYSGSQIGASVANLSAGFDIGNGFASAANVFNGQFIITNISNNLWAAFGIVGGSNAAFMGYMSGVNSLSGTLDRVRITAVNGTDTFDAGTINILYE